jgi:uncharacterized coiled-coil protein SlyX
MTPVQNASRSKWQHFVSLEWFDALLDFVFKLTAKSSEVLLAAGVILSTANHFQHGSLFTTMVLQQGKPVSVDTVLFEIWTWTQAIGFEASAGVVLASALDAQRNKDIVKRNVLLTLMGGLAFVGTTMLVMAFVEAATGFRERDLPAEYGIIMSVLRGVVSVAYVTIGRVKNRRFSGAEVVSVTTVPDLVTQMTELSNRVRQVGANVEQRIQQIETNNQRTFQHITERLEAFTEQWGQMDAMSEGVRQLTEYLNGSLKDLTEAVREGNQDDPVIPHLALLLATLEESKQVLETLPALAASLGQMEEITTSQLQVVAEEVTQVKTTLLEHKKALFSAPPTVRSLSRPKSERSVMSQTTIEEDAFTERLVASSPNVSWDKGAFVRSCLSENPTIRNAEIQRKAREQGRTVSAAYVSEIRKVFFVEFQKLQ